MYKGRFIVQRKVSCIVLYYCIDLVEKKFLIEHRESLGDCANRNNDYFIKTEILKYYSSEPCKYNSKRIKIKQGRVNLLLGGSKSVGIDRVFVFFTS